LLVGVDIDPAVIRKTATWKSDNVRPCAVDNREFQIAVSNGAVSISFHSMMDDGQPSSQPTSVI